MAKPTGRTKSRKGPTAIGDIVSELIARRGVGRVRSSAVQIAAWRRAAGDDMAAATRPGAIRRGVLQVTVADSPTLQELMFQKADILVKLASKHPELGIRDVKFRVGPLD